MTDFFFFVLKVRLFTEHQVESLWMSPTMLVSSVKSIMKLVAWIGVNHECIVSIEPGSGRSLWGAGDRCECNTHKLVESEGEVGAEL